ncbi:MAG: S8 family serine peptidase [Myxococcota bacterium]|nr:S8 family serine peptidase [Myxococcota bacterium]
MALAVYTFILAAAAAPLDPMDPPTPLGGGQFDFGGGVSLTVLPRVVVVLPEGEPPPAGAESLGGRSWLVPTASPDAAIALTLSLQTRPGFSVWPDVILPIQHASFDDPSWPGQWYSEDLEMEALYAASMGDASVRVAVIDSGIDIGHPDLSEAIDDPYDAWSDDDDPSPDLGEYCYDGSQAICDGHGTAVSGVIAARANNGVGIVGLCPECTLVPIKLLGEGTSANTLSTDIAAFEHAIAADAWVINNSWGFVESIPVPEPLAAVIRRAATEPRDGLGAVVVFAAGNDDRSIEDDEMQAMPEVLCVSATDSYGHPTAYTNSGASVDIAAPSATVTLAPEEGITETFGGTSAAAPVISGLAGWVLSVAPERSAEEVRQLLLDTAVPSPLVTHDDEGHHDTYGYGEVSALALLDALSAVDTGGEAQKSCGCVSGGSGSAWGLVFITGLLMWRRR